MFKLVAKDCYDFALRVTNTTYKLYSNRQCNAHIEKLVKQHYQAKLCEWYVYFYLIYKNYDCTKPDMTVYSALNKSYDADLYIKNKSLRIHVKCLNIKLKSVLFQKDEIKDFGENDYICIVKYENNTFEIISFKSALDYIYLSPKKNMPSKVAVYL